MMVTIADIFVQDWLDPWHWQSACRLLIAACLGGLIGAERKSHGAAAGFRTQMLVCTGSALAMVVSVSFAKIFTGTSDGILRIDPARIAYGVMAGIGFLGAGAIIQSKIGVKGLTTAASCWCTAAIGLAAGLGLMVQATSATVIVLFTLFVLRRFDTMIHPHWVRSLTVTVRESQGDLITQVLEILENSGIATTLTRCERTVSNREEIISMRVSVPRHLNESEVLTMLQDIPGLVQIQLR
ncbi:MAG TPA: MgtC/SapB family protein [Phycisphaerae bacterium]|nr:MgtC/SapB family protein [Phycisphaerae bacterium]